MFRLIPLIFLALPALANDQNVSGSFYLEKCENYNSAPQAMQGWCTGFLMGAWEGSKGGASRAVFLLNGVTDSADEATNKLLNVCQPNGVTYGQMSTIFISYLLRNRAELDVPARYLVVEALSEAFPCY